MDMAESLEPGKIATPRGGLCGYGIHDGTDRNVLENGESRCEGSLYRQPGEDPSIHNAGDPSYQVERGGIHGL